MEIKSLRVVYQTPCFFGGTKQTEDTTYYVSREKLKKAFSYLKSHPTTTAVWIDFGDHSWGVWFDSETDATYGKTAVKYSANGGVQINMMYEMPFDKLKHDVYEYLEK